MLYLKRDEWVEGKDTQSDSFWAAGNLLSSRHTAEPLITWKVLWQLTSLIYLSFWDCLVSSLLPPDIVSVHLIFFKH